MSYSQWSLVSDALSSSSCAANPVTSGVVALPNGNDGSFVHGFHSITNDVGVVAYYSTQSGFAPTSKMGLISAAMQKGLGAGNDKHSPFLFAGLGGTSSTNMAYLLGLDESATPRIVIRKGQLANGIPAVAPGSQGVLRRSSTTIAIGTWIHLKLDAILQPGGDVLIQCFQNDVAANGIDSPVWEAIDGISDFTDDASGINSALLGITGSDSAPLTSGRMGFGTRVSDANRNSYFAHIGPEKQTLP